MIQPYSHYCSVRASIIVMFPSVLLVETAVIMLLENYLHKFKYLSFSNVSAFEGKCG